MFCIAAGDGSSVTVKADPIEREAFFEPVDPFYTPADSFDWRELKPAGG